MTDFIKSLIRSKGINLFVLPGDLPNEPLGRAYMKDGRPHIDVFTGATGVRLSHVMAHELAHHDLGHTQGWSSLPTWRAEYEAEMAAIEMMAPWMSYEEMAGLEDDARLFLRPILQAWIDDGITAHGEMDAAVWAGCDISYGEIT